MVLAGKREAPLPVNIPPSRVSPGSGPVPDNAPVLISPAENETLEFFNAPAFNWQPVNGAGAYKIQIATAPDFTNLRYSQTTLATSHQPTEKLANGAYYWRVIPIDPVNREGTYSQTRAFTIGYNQVPVLIEPANRSFPTFTPTFRWTAVLGAQFYRLQYSTDPTFNAAITSIDTANTTFTPRNTLPNHVNYYWRVRVHSGESISDWSNVWTFRKQWYIQPVLLTPVNLYQFVRFPFFSWTPVPGASFYRVEVDRDQDFVGLLLGAFTSNPFYMPDYYVGDLGVRYWRVIPLMMGMAKLASLATFRRISAVIPSLHLARCIHFIIIRRIIFLSRTNWLPCSRMRTVRQLSPYLPGNG